jgi:hypothetical protein
MKVCRKTEGVFIFSSVIIFLLSALSLNAQNVQWTHTYGGPGHDGAQSMTMTDDGGIVIVGFESPYQLNYSDILLIKTDTAGNELWSKIYNLNLNDVGRSICLTSDGGFIIAGMTEVTPQIYDPFLIKTDKNGNLQWSKQYDYGLGLDDRGHSVRQTSDNGYIIAGQTRVFHGAFADYDMYIIKTDAGGNLQWTKLYHYDEFGGNEVASSIRQLSDGGYIIGGFTQSSEWASYIVRTDSLGNVIWSNVYPGIWQSGCDDILPAIDGGFIMTGIETSYETDGDLMLAKLSSTGNLLWKKIYGTTDYEEGFSVQQLQDSGYIVVGMTGFGAGVFDMYIIRTNSSGDSLWSRTIGGTMDDRAFSVVSPNDGTYFVSGWAWSYGQGWGDFYMAKLTEPLVGSIANNNEFPRQFKLAQNFPNPFNPVTVIKFNITSTSKVKLAVYNIQGKEIAVLTDKIYEPGFYEKAWNGENYSSGVYLYKIEAVSINSPGLNFAETRKMILLK